MLDCYNNLFGYNIIGVPYMADLVQARTHKKKRINKKWRKRYGVKEVPWNKFYIEGSRIYCHPKMIETIKAEIYMR
jgi:cbb3-type cytochrome oxidase cytochrome c subunit